MLGNDFMRSSSVAGVSEKQVRWKGRKEPFSVSGLTIVRRLPSNIIVIKLQFIIHVPIFNLIRHNIFNLYWIINFQIL